MEMSVSGKLFETFTGNGLTPDANQIDAIALLQRLSDEIETSDVTNCSLKGIYLWGGVGRGKTLLMDVFFSGVAVDRKLRLHYHRLIQKVHHELQDLPPGSDALDKVADNFAARYRLICLDEFQIMDIGDAMILYGLLKGLMERNVILVTTSNRHPDDLYLGGVALNKILPAIELLTNNTDIFHLSGDVDYRLVHGLQAKEKYYFYPHDENTDDQLQVYFDKVSKGDVESDTDILVQGRPITTRHISANAVWFDFTEICDGPRASSDYLEISRRYDIVIVSALPQFYEDLESSARRFLNLVDELYDSRVHLVLSSNVMMESLYQGERLVFEFERAISRLREMQSEIYFRLQVLTPNVLTRKMIRRHSEIASINSSLE